MAQHSPVPLTDYERIFQVALGALEASGSNVTHRSCVFFGAVGSAILERHYGMAANFYVGSFALVVDAEQRKVVAFGRPRGGDLLSDQMAFHAWVECGGWLIDFSAPLMGASARASGQPWDAPPKMLQKRMADAKASLYDLQATGDFYADPNLALTADVIRLQGQSFARCWEDALRWYRKPPEPLPEQALLPGQGVATTLAVRVPGLHDAW